MPTPEKEADQFVEIAVQAFGPGRTEQLMGREYRVFPAVLVRNQVLQNNLGRTYLPPEEITPEWAAGLNGAPVIVDHPSKMGQPVSAKDPEILNARGIGFLFNGQAGPGSDGVLEVRADVWLEAARAAEVKELDVILAKLDRNESPEISTGFPLRGLEETPGAHNGKEYDRVLRPGGWDHLAVFADTKRGACSVKDGCRLNVNHEGSCNFNPNHDPDDGRFTSGSGGGKDQKGASIGVSIKEGSTVTIAGKSGRFRVIGLDSDPSARVWVVDIDNPDKEFFVSRSDMKVANVNHEGPCHEDQIELLPDPVPATNEVGDTPQEGCKMTRDEMVAHLAQRGPLCKVELEKLGDTGLAALCEAPATVTNSDEDTAVLQKRVLELRRQKDELEASTSLAVQQQKEERQMMIEELIYRGNTKFSEAAINGMDLPTLRNLYGTVFERHDYSTRGGPRASNAGPSFGFVTDALDRKEAN